MGWSTCLPPLPFDRLNLIRGVRPHTLDALYFLCNKRDVWVSIPGEPKVVQNHTISVKRIPI